MKISDIKPLVGAALALLALTALTGCRSAKPATAFEAVSDSLSASANSISVEAVDSLSVSDEVRMKVKDAVRFVDGGGSILLSPDGAISISGVASVSRSALGSSSQKTNSKRLKKVTLEKDTVSVSHSSSSSWQSKDKSSPLLPRLGGRCIGLALMILFVVAIMIWIRRNK